MSASNRPIVLVPYVTRIEPECERGLQALEKNGLTIWRFQSITPIDRTRCDMATAALERGADELIWIDPDVSFRVQDVDRLRSHLLPFIAGVCPGADGSDLAVYPEDGAAKVWLGPDGGLRDVRYVGAGFLYTQRAVYDDIRRTFSLPMCDTKFGDRTVPYFLPMVIAEEGAYWYLSAAFSFCERARAANYNLVVDTAIQLERVATHTHN